MRLIYLSAVPWGSFAQRPHKFVEWFRSRTNGEVLWLDPYPTRFPALADLSRFQIGAAGGGVTTPSWLRVVQVRAMPIEPLPGSGCLNRVLWRPLLSQAEAFAAGDDALLVVGKPTLLALQLMSRLSQCRTLYDAMDDFPAFYRGLSRRAMARREQALVRRVDAVWASSSALARRWQQVRADAERVCNGLDASLLPIPRQRQQRERRVFGYVGTIASWFDWELVIALAHARPQDQVRLIGPIYARCPGPLPENIELRAPCEHGAALQEMNDFDVGLIPFKLSTLTAGVDPIKYYEYRALGVPVLSTAFGEMALRDGEPGVYLAHGKADLEAAAAAAAMDESPLDVHFAQRNDWGARFDAACFTMGFRGGALKWRGVRP